MMDWQPVEVETWLKNRPFWSDVISQTLAGLIVAVVVLVLGGVVALAALGTGSIKAASIFAFVGLSAFAFGSLALVFAALVLCNRGRPIYGVARTSWTVALLLALVLAITAMQFTDLTSVELSLLIGAHLLAFGVGAIWCGSHLGGIRLTRAAFAAGALLGLSGAVGTGITIGVILARATGD